MTNRFFALRCSPYLNNTFLVVVTATLVHDYYIGWHDWITKALICVNAAGLLCKGFFWLGKSMSRQYDGITVATR